MNKQLPLLIILAMAALNVVTPASAQSLNQQMFNNQPFQPQSSSNFDLGLNGQAFSTPATARMGTNNSVASSAVLATKVGVSAINNKSLGLAPTMLGLLTQGSQGGLPSTSMDSFVANAGGMAELIYGDEGEEGPPPYFEFTEEHRIERGINEPMLTTGHRSSLPEAWGWPQ